MDNQILDCLLELLLIDEELQDYLGYNGIGGNICKKHDDITCKLFELLPALKQLYSQEKGLSISVVLHGCNGTGPHYMDTYDVILKDFGSNKLKVKQFLRSISDFSLSEVLKLELPRIIFKTIYEKEANNLKDGLELLGGCSCNR